MIYIPYRIRVYVGPVHVAHFANMARQAGYTEVSHGTEHVYATLLAQQLTCATDALVLRVKVVDIIHGEPMGAGAWRDVEIVNWNGQGGMGDR